MKTEVRKDELTEADGPEPMPGDRAAQDLETAAEGPLADDQVQQLKTQAAKADEYWNQLLRTAADLDNYKKRAGREKQEAIRYANESLLQKLIPVLDNFEMALSAASTTEGTADSVQQGVSMIQQQLKQVLTDAGLEEIIA